MSWLSLLRIFSGTNLRATSSRQKTCPSNRLFICPDGKKPEPADSTVFTALITAGSTPILLATLLYAVSDIPVFSFSIVAGPAIPSTVSPEARWNALTYSVVTILKLPSIVIG